MSPYRKLRKLHMRVAPSPPPPLPLTRTRPPSLSLSTSLFNLRLIPPQRDVKWLTANVIEGRSRLSVARCVMARKELWEGREREKEGGVCNGRKLPQLRIAAVRLSDFPCQASGAKHFLFSQLLV